MKNTLKLTELNKREMSRIMGGDAPCKCGCYCGCAPSEAQASVLTSPMNSANNNSENAKPSSAKD